jgi:hypothetical protein
MQRRKLPPLILHPFADAAGPVKLAEGSRAGLALSGILPAEERDAEMLERQLVEGRYCELSMLFYLGKDLLRWMDQCAEALERAEGAGEGTRAESFAALLIDDPPAGVAEKLRGWGVYEHQTIFARALGLHAVFDSLPAPSDLSRDFVRHYHRFADQMFACRQQLFPFTPASSTEFDFEIYASNEYSQMLEREWGEMPN